MKNIYCIVGPSGVGKTTVVEYLEQNYNLKTISSYTDRPKRRDDETGHIFVTPEQFDHLGKLVAYTEYNGFRYGVTPDFIDSHDLYVIDPPGVRMLKEKYRGRKGIKIIGLTADTETLRYRMWKRGDSPEAINKRIATDAQWFSRSRLGFSYDLLLHANGIIPTGDAIWEYIKHTEKYCSPDLKIYQINPDYDFDGVVFCGSTELKQRAKRQTGSDTHVFVNLSIYDEVWSGDMSFTSLDEVYEYFNSDMRPNPNDYHSLSVSDIVEIAHNPVYELNGRWFVDSFGFRKLDDDVYLSLA